MNAPTHFRRSLLCPIVVRTTGTSPFYHEVIDIRMIALDENFKFNPEVTPFHLMIKPKKATFKTNSKIKEYGRLGKEPYDAFPILDSWFQKQKAKGIKKLIPLAYQWSSLRPFLENLMGFDEEYNSFLYDIFSEDYREVYTLAVSNNDKQYLNGEEYVFDPFSLDQAKVLNNLKLERFGSENIFWRCMDLAQAYRKIINDVL